jgi:putative transposase
MATSHVVHTRLQMDVNNNELERMNGELRDREKVMRGLKKMNSPIIKGLQQYHNYFRDHDTLEGKNSC